MVIFDTYNFLNERRYKTKPFSRIGIERGIRMSFLNKKIILGYSIEHY